MGSLVAELAEKLSSATNNLDFDEQTLFLNTSADTVGIGTNSPASKLDVRGTMQVGVNDTGYDVTFFGDAAGAAMIWDTSANALLVRGATADAAGSSGRIVLQTAQVGVADGDILGRVDFQAPLETEGSDGALVSASIWAEADDTFTATVNSTELVFATATDDAVVERMRVASDGNVGIADNNPSYKLSVTGDIYSSSSLGIGTAPSGTTGQIRATDDITAFYSSDISLKENISPISNALDKISQISGVQFDWNKEYIDKNGGEDGYFVRKRDVGVIAQEIQKVLPEVVAKRSNGTLAVKYDRIIALLIEAIKELKNR